MKRTFSSYSTMRLMVYHIEKYSSEKLFEEDETTLLNVTGK